MRTRCDVTSFTGCNGPNHACQRRGIAERRFASPSHLDQLRREDRGGVPNRGLDSAPAPVGSGTVAVLGRRAHCGFNQDNGGLWSYRISVQQTPFREKEREMTTTSRMIALLILLLSTPNDAIGAPAPAYSTTSSQGREVLIHATACAISGWGATWEKQAPNWIVKVLGIVVGRHSKATRWLARLPRVAAVLVGVTCPETWSAGASWISGLSGNVDYRHYRRADELRELLGEQWFLSPAIDLLKEYELEPAQLATVSCPPRNSRHFEMIGRVPGVLGRSSSNGDDYKDFGMTDELKEWLYEDWHRALGLIVSRGEPGPLSTAHRSFPVDLSEGRRGEGDY